MTEVKPGLYIEEPVSKSTRMATPIRRIIAFAKTRYQEAIVAEIEEFGLSLILDGYTQSTELDEFIYHEALVHPAMVTHERPEKVLVVGGGEGATLREVLKHNTVREAVMVDIDGEVVELCKKHLTVMHQGSFFDSRAKLVIMDGKRYIEEAESGAFDVVILDLTDPYSSDVARGLYTAEFYRSVYRVLSERGVVVTQAGSSFFYGDVYDWVLNNVKLVFPIVREYSIWVPSFGYACNFIIGSKGRDPAALSLEEVEKTIDARGLRGKLKLYSGRVHVALMLMPVFRKR